MDSLLAEKSNNSRIIHPVTLNLFNNKKNKRLSFPVGPGNIITEQNYFSSEPNTINSNSEEVFLSGDYFFKAIFGANTFDERIEALSMEIDTIKEFNTIDILLFNLSKSTYELTDKTMNDLIELHRKIDIKKDNEHTYQETYDAVKNFYQNTK